MAGKDALLLCAVTAKARQHSTRAGVRGWRDASAAARRPISGAWPGEIRDAIVRIARPPRLRPGPPAHPAHTASHLESCLVCGNVLREALAPDACASVRRRSHASARRADRPTVRTRLGEVRRARAGAREGHAARVCQLHLLVRGQAFEAQLAAARAVVRNRRRTGAAVAEIDPACRARSVVVSDALRLREREAFGAQRCSGGIPERRPQRLRRHACELRAEVCERCRAADGRGDKTRRLSVARRR